MPKHFKATHKESGEVVEFDLEDLQADTGYNIGLYRTDYYVGSKDYNLQYLHNGEYHDYTDERSEAKKEGVE